MQSCAAASTSAFFTDSWFPTFPHQLQLFFSFFHISLNPEVLITVEFIPNRCKKQPSYFGGRKGKGGAITPKEAAFCQLGCSSAVWAMGIVGGGSVPLGAEAFRSSQRGSRRTIRTGNKMSAAMKDIEDKGIFPWRMGGERWRGFQLWVRSPAPVGLVLFWKQNLINKITLEKYLTLLCSSWKHLKRLWI